MNRAFISFAILAATDAALTALALQLGLPEVALISRVVISALGPIALCFWWLVPASINYALFQIARRYARWPMLIWVWAAFPSVWNLLQILPKVIA